jgi:adrenodoxin-NADP+ reductase
LLQNEWKIAIVGSGPSGCYTAKYLQQALNKKEGEGSSSCQIDILERLPTAYGLVRNGVAPDHPEVKNVQNDFDALFNEADGGIQFWGNVQVGRDVSLHELRTLYDVVVLAFGCESDRTLNIPNHDLLNILTARQFVNWYNGHPEFDWVGPVVQEALAAKSDDRKQHIVVIGHGNVALDCARILAKTREELIETDLTTRALDVLHSSPNTQRHIDIVGRRGHIQGAFTIKEVRELTKLPHAKFVIRQDELEHGASTEASQQELKSSKPKQRIDKLLRDNATAEMGEDVSDDGTQIHLRFLMNPVRFEARPHDDKLLGAVVCERTQLQGDAGKQSAHGTGQEEFLLADLCLVSIGYKGIPIEGTEEYYDDARGILKNTNGVVDNQAGNDLAPLYVSGWLKRGPSGIIGTNIADAKDTVESIVNDLQGDQRVPKAQTQSLLKQLLEERNVQVVDWDSYLRINDQETSPKRLRSPNQPREKLTEWQDLLEAAIEKSNDLEP